MSIWSGEFGGTPNWNNIHPKDFEAKFTEAIEKSLSDIDEIAHHTEKASFENTILELERAGKELSELSAIFYVHCSNLNTGEMPKIEKRVRGLLVEHQNKIDQNQELFARISSVYETKDELGLEERRLLDKIYTKYVRAGASLGEEKKEILSQLKRETQGLQIIFKQNILDDQKGITWVEDETELAGMADKYKKSCNYSGHLLKSKAILSKLLPILPK